MQDKCVMMFHVLVPMATRQRLPMLPNVGDLLRMLGIPANKRLAQNFLLDMNINRKLVRRAGGRRLAGHRICEIGPGPGGITRALLEQQPDRLDVIEIDHRFLPMLDLLKDVSDGRLNVYHENVLKFDWTKLWNAADDRTDFAEPWMSDQLPKYHLIGNLPFNISLPLLIQLLRHMSERTGPYAHGRVPCTFTFQQEIGVRMAASVDHVERSRLSVACEYLAHCQPVMDMPYSVFSPRPKVDVALMRVEPRRVPLIRETFEVINKFLRHLFHYRQKRVYRALLTLYPDELQEELTNELLERSAIPATSRCFELPTETIGAGARVYGEQCRRVPGLFLYEYRHPQPMPVLAMQPDCLPRPYVRPPDEAEFEVNRKKLLTTEMRL